MGSELYWVLIHTTFSSYFHLLWDFKLVLRAFSENQVLPTGTLPFVSCQCIHWDGFRSQYARQNSTLHHSARIPTKTEMLHQKAAKGSPVLEVELPNKIFGAMAVSLDMDKKALFEPKEELEERLGPIQYLSPFGRKSFLRIKESLIHPCLREPPPLKVQSCFQDETTLASLVNVHCSRNS